MMAKPKTPVRASARTPAPVAPPTPKPPKTTSDAISAIAGKWLNMPANDIIAIAAKGSRPDHTEAEWEALVRMVDDFQRLAGSCLSQ
jgi:hypothetical protein